MNEIRKKKPIEEINKPKFGLKRKSVKLINF